MYKLKITAKKYNKIKREKKREKEKIRFKSWVKAQKGTINAFPGYRTIIIP